MTPEFTTQCDLGTSRFHEVMGRECRQERAEGRVGGGERVLRRWTGRRNLGQGLEGDMGSSGACGFLLTVDSSSGTGINSL